MTITEMQNLAQVHGRKDLYILTVGTIASISNSSSTPAEIVEQIKETLLALEVVRPDESIPWHAKRLPAKESLEETTDDMKCLDKFIQLEFNTEDAPLPNFPTEWSLKDILRNAG